MASHNVDISSQCERGNLGSFNEDQCLSFSLINFFTPLKLTKINQVKPEKSNQKILQPVEINKGKNFVTCRLSKAFGF